MTRGSERFNEYWTPHHWICRESIVAEKLVADLATRFCFPLSIRRTTTGTGRKVDGRKGRGISVLEAVPASQP